MSEASSAVLTRWSPRSGMDSRAKGIRPLHGPSADDRRRREGDEVSAVATVETITGVHQRDAVACHVDGGVGDLQGAEATPSERYGRTRPREGNPGNPVDSVLGYPCGRSGRAVWTSHPRYLPGRRANSAQPTYGR